MANSSSTVVELNKSFACDRKKSANWVLRLVGGNRIQLSTSSRGISRILIVLNTTVSISMYCWSSRSICTSRSQDCSPTVHTGDRGVGVLCGRGFPVARNNRRK